MERLHRPEVPEGAGIVPVVKSDFAVMALIGYGPAEAKAPLKLCATKTS